MAVIVGARATDNAELAAAVAAGIPLAAATDWIDAAASDGHTIAVVPAPQRAHGTVTVVVGTPIEGGIKSHVRQTGGS